MIIMQKVKIYSDGAARGNPDGPGGYGTVVKYLDDNDIVTRIDEFTGGYPITTNNRMELMGVIAGLESLREPSSVIITSDSAYVVNAFNKKWIDNWLLNGWKSSTGKAVKNDDLWKRLLLVKNPHEVEFVWVKGHNGHPENERCDYLATSSADGKVLVKNKDGIFEEKAESDE